MTKTESHCDHCGKFVSVDYSQCCGLRDTLPFNMDFAICESCEAKSQTRDEGGTYLLDDDYWIEWIAERKDIPVSIIQKIYSLMQDKQSLLDDMRKIYGCTDPYKARDIAKKALGMEV